VKTHHELPKTTIEEAVALADQGIQTVAGDAIIGLGEVRYLPDPTPDPLEDLKDKP
jgi:hypothetical protein